MEIYVNASKKTNEFSEAIIMVLIIFYMLIINTLNKG